MFDTQLTGDKKTGALTLSGDLIIDHIDAVKEAFIQALDKYNDLTVHIKKLELIDFSCLQLFCAAHKSAVQQKKKLTFQIPSDDAFNKLLTQTGFLVGDGGAERGARGFILKGVT